jgi:hypothetical protein
MARQSLILLPGTMKQVNVVGRPVKAAGYYGSGSNLHTVAVYLNNFSGHLFIDATLASKPEEDDWFPINLNGYVDYIDYPYTPPMGFNPVTGVNGIDSFSFDGNFVYIRARIDRSYLPNFQTTDFGAIDKILVNY